MEAYIVSPTTSPYVGKQLTVLFHTQPLLKYLVYSNAAPGQHLKHWLQSPTRLGIRLSDLDLPTEYSLGLSAASIHRFASQVGITHYSQLVDTTVLY